MFWGKYNYLNSSQNSPQNIMEDNLVYTVFASSKTILLNPNIHSLSLHQSFAYFSKVISAISTASTVSYKVKALGYTCTLEATW